MDASATAYHALRTRCGVADFSRRVKLQLTGVDRVRYLNGQVTSNVQKLAAGQAQPACVTTAKGRLCADIMITSGADRLLVDADASLTETLPARLERYLIADDVAISALPAETRLLHFTGPPPELPGTLIATTRLGRAGWDWWTDFATAERAWPMILERVCWSTRHCASWSASRLACRAGAASWAKTRCPRRPGSTARTSTTTRAATSGRK